MLAPDAGFVRFFLQFTNLNICSNSEYFITTKRVCVEEIKRWRVVALKYINILDITCHFLFTAL